MISHVNVRHRFVGYKPRTVTRRTSATEPAESSSPSTPTAGVSDLTAFGFASILLELEDIAPVTAVLGNTDDPGTGFKELEAVQLGGRSFVVHHIVDPARLSDRMQLACLHHSPEVIVYGHTHQAHHEVRDGRLFLNPGYAGRRKGDERRTVAILRMEPGTEMEIDFVELG